jgi:hypothetical protein
VKSSGWVTTACPLLREGQGLAGSEVVPRWFRKAELLSFPPYWIVSKRLEVLEAHQLNLGLYTTRVTAEAEGAAPPLVEVVAALRELVVRSEAIE